MATMQNEAGQNKAGQDEAGQGKACDGRERRYRGVFAAVGVLAALTVTSGISQAQPSAQKASPATALSQNDPTAPGKPVAAGPGKTGSPGSGKTASPEGEAVSPEIVAAYKFGHQKACLADTGRQLRAGGITLDDSRLEAYCTCLGAAYFDDLTVEQHETMRKKDWTALPPGLAERSEAIQNRCFDTSAAL